MWPHRLGGLLDADVAASEKSRLAHAFVGVRSCCVDSSFSGRLKEYMQAGWH